jgi:hypothetical protein
MTTAHFDGGCFCGCVRYRVTGAVKFVAHDHCSICRRTSGAAFVTWCGVKEEQLALVDGDGDLTTFASSADAQRQFCKRCGSHLFFRSKRWPGEVHFTLATVLSPEGLTPTVHVFWDDRTKWLEGSETLPHRGGVTGLEPISRR